MKLSRKLALGLIGGGGYAPHTYDFTLAASDSFNRSNGALGNTDGAGIDGVTGGSGLGWTEKVGTWAVATNHARAATVSSSTAIATVDTSKTDGVAVVRPTLASAASGGICGRYVDADNFCLVYVTLANTVIIYQKVAGTPTTLFSKAATYVANAELIARFDGLRVSVEYNGVYYGAATINAALAASTLFGIWTNVAGSTIFFEDWNFVNLPTYQAIDHPSIVQALTGEYLITTPVRNEAARCIEWDLRQEKSILAGYAFTSNVRHLFGLKLVTIATGAKVVLSTNAGWESAGQIGANADIQGDYGYFGSTHQSEQSTAFTLTIPALTTLSRWKRVYCARVQVDQSINTVYPKDKTTVIGTTTMRHVFGRTGLTLTRSHTYDAGYKLYGWYGAMMPVYNPSVDTYKVGDAATAAMVLDDGSKNLNTQAAYYKAWLATTGDFTMVMRLPTGGPDDAGDWSKAGAYKGWFKDNTTSDQKFYVNYIDGNFAGVAAAVASSHTAEYYVETGIP